MRQFAVIVLLALFGCAPKSSNLDGTWKPVRQELGGHEMPAAFFEKQVLVISDSSYTLTAESVDKGVLRYFEGKMDIVGKEGVNAGRHFTAIYVLNNDSLKICYNLAGDSYPEAFETKSKPALFMSVFQKAAGK